MVLPRAACTQAFVTVILLYSSRRVEGKDVEGFHGGDLTKLEQEKICFNFTEGNPEKKEFYSPNFPYNYPNNTKCEFQLKAPHGHVIQLDFRETFHLEDSLTCEYDWLEIRNGPHGYSPLIKKFCGHEFPPLLTSQDRFLWLKFSSDDSIEYEGFKAIYEFIRVEDFERPQAEDCTFTRGGAGGMISPMDVSKSILNYSLTWKVPLDCTWVVHVATGWKLYVTFQKYDLRHKNNCDLNFIDIYEGALSDDTRMAQFCGTTTEPQKSDGNLVYVRYFAQPEALDGKFQIVFTAFRESDKCLPHEFSCDDGTCIDKSLKCNKMFNCKYRYDEDTALCTPAMTAGRMLASEHMITILIVFFALVVAMCASIVITCYNKVKDRREKKREYKMRRSKEVSMEGEMDRVLANMDPGLEAALAAQAAEIGAARGKVPPPRWLDEEESSGCYVPEVDLSIFHKSPNGGHVISREGASDGHNAVGIHIISNSSFPDGVNPLCKEHGALRGLRRGSFSPPLPPPPPPPHVRRAPPPIDNDNPHHHGMVCQKHNAAAYHHQQQQRIAYLEEQQQQYQQQQGATQQQHQQDTAVPLPPTFRAEAVVEQLSPESRPRSFDSTRSAPDVIVHR